MKELLAYKAVIMAAESLGFYKLESKKPKKCIHAGCGYKRLHSYDCWPLYYAQSKSYTGYSNYTQELPKHTKAGCTLYWCVIRAGGPKPSAPTKPQCRQQRFIKYSEQEISVPGVIPEAAAIMMKIAVDGDYLNKIHGSLVALYDLHNDVWRLDSWWRTAGKNLLIPENQLDKLPTPSQISHVSEVVDSLKKSL